jgi:phage recombination protein Bet
MDTKAITTFNDQKGMPVALSYQIVRDYLTGGNKDINDQEIMLFIETAKAMQLNPFKKEIYLSKFGGKPAMYMVAYEVFIKRASRNPNYDGFTVEHVLDSHAAPYSATATVFRKDRSHDMIATVYFKEVNKGQATWNTMPVQMMEKCAIARAMRWAFPEEEDMQDVIVEGEQSETVDAAATTLEGSPVTRTMQTLDGPVEVNTATGEIAGDPSAMVDEPLAHRIAEIGKTLGWKMEDWLTHLQRIQPGCTKLMELSMESAKALYAKQNEYATSFNIDLTAKADKEFAAGETLL